MIAILSLGSNLGNRENNLEQAVDRISLMPNTNILKKSGIIETKAWGNTSQPDFLNMAIMIETQFQPQELLYNLLQIEKHLGRIRTVKWAARSIDIDIIFYEDIVLNNEELTIPHPFMHERNFVLDSLLEICPYYIHPVFNMTVKQIKNKYKEK
ncbi:MAG: 2-amino-4-hydroxy-6-hydroxymethyldihydropteridine diphosphokinase [Candidatus Cloacimonadales bacterium]|jgi:dihydroneopterin aldolase/2-amino-4-hydroxy-6-hydroxymethyldihydropteridine diphosphokinase|nr:2-amino-4-hydroxy-6-hydroxymethyldihydropteridine diphosphokinase [Candidatus Cloacimonadota bacterium]MDD2649750.1 2-amino-4-hydroxy-6-hydroxymethyldihydropteridine diphosphokinase [Candidatus Cloacimonadota bacterium]MDD3501733.1 2-amino-4-hydroxy-6-hydroxymethyldihydropteridine diphosphokinase [Candidatus Cloacimonadota bacterium]MDX9977584.1 2-amino-4-hydroxy-6-hydroxymethyldihydropteridine diphosphokinase [Candidatus Cloacimonadales bacterium]